MIRKAVLAAIGGAIGLTLVGVISREFLSGPSALFYFAGPMGSSAVLLFALPGNKVAQPWPTFGGHMIAAACGLAAAPLFADPMVAVGIAVGASILLMHLANCMHPPAGGMAAMAALGSPATEALGWKFLFLPVALNLVLLLGLAWIWLRLTGQTYPAVLAETKRP